MNKRMNLIFALVSVMSLCAGAVLAVDQAPVQGRARVQEQEQIFGSQLMTDQERLEYHARMRAAQTPEAREQVRDEHHQVMQARAKAQGVALPDEPPARGSGMGAGRGMGPGGGRGR